VKLFRAMAPDADGLPQIGRSARKLGVRTPVEAAAQGSEPDVSAVDTDEVVPPGTGGLSVVPDDPANLPPFRRPATLGGRGKDPVWVIDTNDLGPDLQFRQDSPTHGLIEPSGPVTLDEYELALAATRGRAMRRP
jgi:hypothetical protein